MDQEHFWQLHAKFYCTGKKKAPLTVNKLTWDEISKNAWYFAINLDNLSQILWICAISYWNFLLILKTLYVCLPIDTMPHLAKILYPNNQGMIWGLSWYLQRLSRTPSVNQYWAIVNASLPCNIICSLSRLKFASFKRTLLAQKTILQQSRWWSKENNH